MLFDFFLCWCCLICLFVLLSCIVFFFAWCSVLCVICRDPIFCCGVMIFFCVVLWFDISFRVVLMVCCVVVMCRVVILLFYVVMCSWFCSFVLWCVLLCDMLYVVSVLLYTVLFVSNVISVLCCDVLFCVVLWCIVMFCDVIWCDCVHHSRCTLHAIVIMMCDHVRWWTMWEIHWQDDPECSDHVR